VSTFKQPSGPWAKDPTLKRVGALAYAAAENGYHAYGLGKKAIRRKEGRDCTNIRDSGFYEDPWDDARGGNKLCDAAVQSVGDKNTHTYVNL